MSQDTIKHGMYVEFVYDIVDADTQEALEKTEAPISYIHGGKPLMFPPLIEALAGKSVDDEFSVVLEPEQAFGLHNPQLIYTYEEQHVPEDYRKLGAEIEFKNDQGESKTFLVTAMKDGLVTLDGNYPLSGRRLNFQIRVVSIRAATEQEMESGVPVNASNLH